MSVTSSRARDDGIGRAHPMSGSGLIELRDCIEARGGTISGRSPNGVAPAG